MATLAFCEEEISWSELFSDFNNIYDKYKQIDDVSPLQGVALARELSEAIESFKTKIETISLKGLICAVLSTIDIDSEIAEIENKIKEFFDEFNNFDEAIASISSEGFESLEDIENAVKPIFDNFDSSKEYIKDKIKDGLRVLFEPLTAIGATQEQIDNALEDVELSTNPTELILDTFMDIADSTIRDLN